MLILPSQKFHYHIWLCLLHTNIDTWCNKTLKRSIHPEQKTHNNIVWGSHLIYWWCFVFQNQDGRLMMPESNFLLGIQISLMKFGMFQKLIHLLIQNNKKLLMNTTMNWKKEMIKKASKMWQKMLDDYTKARTIPHVKKRKKRLKSTWQETKVIAHFVS